MGGDADRLARLRLIRSANVGPVSYRQLIARFGSAARALDALPDLAGRANGARFVPASVEQVEAEEAALARAGAQLLFLGDPAYPAALAELENAPPVLSCKGDPGLLARTGVAIVGARNASAAGCRLARSLAYDLGTAGIVVVSGLARGIDAAAHQGALATGTVAVIAGGIDTVYPPDHVELQARIAESGLLLAEMPPGTEPRARHFPYRNRIIAGLSAGTVVVEAVPKSGSLITARLAAEAGRDVMAVPGSPLDPRAQGCNELIRDGAVLVRHAADILEQIAPIDLRVATAAPPRAAVQLDLIEEAGEGERHAVVALLGASFVAVDEIVRLSAMPAAQVQMVLLELELAGRIERGAGGRVRLVA